MSENGDRNLRPVTLAVVLVILMLVLLFCAGVHGPIELIAVLLSGWYRYLTRTLSKVQIDWPGLGSALLWIGLFAAGLHSFCRWLYRGAKTDDGLPPRRWRSRWTAMLLGLVIFLFSAGTAAVCVAHQIGFLATSESPMFAIHDYNANLTTEDLKEFADRRLGSNSTPMQASDLWLDATKYHPFNKPLIDRHHLIVWDGPDGKLAGVILFHRDPALRREHGIVVGIGGRTVVRSADELPEVLKLVPSPTTRPASNPTQRQSEVERPSDTRSTGFLQGAGRQGAVADVGDRHLHRVLVHRGVVAEDLGRDHNVLVASLQKPFSQPPGVRPVGRGT